MSKPLKVFIKPLRKVGYIHDTSTIDKGKEYYVRFKGSRDSYVGRMFKSSQIFDITNNSENAIKFFKLVNWEKSENN